MIGLISACRRKAFHINQFLNSISVHLNQAKVETHRLPYFRLGYCGSVEEVIALTSVAIGAAGSFLFTFFRKKSKSHCPA
jgi:hypothetical protein